MCAYLMTSLLTSLLLCFMCVCVCVVFAVRIKRCDSDVVADQFLFGHSSKMVVTLPQNVFMQQLQQRKQ